MAMTIATNETTAEVEATMESIFAGEAFQARLESMVEQKVQARLESIWNKTRTNKEDSTNRTSTTTNNGQRRERSDMEEGAAKHRRNSNCSGVSTYYTQNSNSSGASTYRRNSNSSGASTCRRNSNCSGASTIHKTNDRDSNCDDDENSDTEQDESSSTNDDDDDESIDDESIDEILVSDEDIMKELFVNSTHRLLFLDEIPLPDGREPYKVNPLDRFVALFVIALQIFAYSVLMLSVQEEARTNGWDSPTIGLEIEAKYCHHPKAWSHPAFYYDKLTEGEVTAENFLDLLQCSELNNWQDDTSISAQAPLTFVAAICLLICFLLSDLFEVFLLFPCSDWRAKATSILVFFKALVCLGVAVTGIFGNGNAFSLLDTFLFVVGVIFVHDLDENFGYIRDVLRRVNYPTHWRYKCCSCCRLEVQLGIYLGIVCGVSVAMMWISGDMVDRHLFRPYGEYVNWNDEKDNLFHHGS